MNGVNVPERFLDEAKSMACVHCGLCLGSCPTYLETGNENDSPRGRIHLMRAIQEGRMDLASEPVRHLDLCLGCRACETACPSGVAYGDLLEQARHHVESHHRRSLPERLLRNFLIEKVFPYPERMELALRPAQWLREMGLSRFAPRRLAEMMDLIPKSPGEALLPSFSPATGTGNKGRAALLTGCVMKVLFGGTHASTVRLLKASGWSVAIPPAQVCCGALHSHSGGLELARESAKKNVAVFEQADVDVVVVNAAGCGAAMKSYGALLAGDAGWSGRAKAFSAKVRDLSEVLDLPTQSVKAWTGGLVTYHDACHLAHAQGITRQPRDWVRAIAGAQYVALPEADVCCGSAGSYNLTEPEMAGRLQRRKVGKIEQTGALTVVTSNPGCQMQMEAGLRRAGNHHVRAVHLADFLAEALFGVGQ